MSDEGPTCLDLFAGIGGFSLAAHWAGFRTVAFCEISPYCQAVLKKNFGAVDADAGERGLGAKQRHILPWQSDSQGRHKLYSDIRTFDGTRYRGVDLLTAGVPCQPASCAGKRQGTSDDRWLWPDALRILGEAKPTFAVFENPVGLLTLEDGLVFEALLSQMEGHSYEVCPPIVIPACGVQADYYRYRVFVVAHLTGGGRGRRWQASGDLESGQGEERERVLEPTGCAIGHSSKSVRAGLAIGEEQHHGQCAATVGSGGPIFPDTDGSLLRTVSRLSPRMDRSAREPHRRERIHALGNSVVPAQVFPLLQAIRALIP